MKKLRLVVMLALVTASCRGCSTGPAQNNVEEAAHADEAAHDDDLLHIEPGMLRDLRITTAAVESRTGVAEASMLGELTVDQDTYAEVASPIEAQVLRLAASANTQVKAGELLAELRSQELGRARAALADAESRWTLATQTLERKRGLAADRIIALREVQEAEAALREADAAKRAAEAQIQALGVSLQEPPLAGDASRFALRAPLGGTVLERLGAIGQRASPDAPLFRIGDLSRLWLVVHAFERDAVRIAAGAPARITFAALPGREFTGRVSAIGREVERSSRSVDVRIDLPNASGELRPGMSATAYVPVGNENRQLLTVPVAAVQRVGENWVVFLQKEEGGFEVRPVGRGRDLGAEVELLRGVTAGEMVVVDGAFLLKAEAEKASGAGEHAH